MRENEMFEEPIEKENEGLNQEETSYPPVQLVQPPSRNKLRNSLPTKKKTIFLSIACLFSGLCLILNIISLAAWTNSKQVIDTAWLSASGSDYQAYFGLRGVFVKSSSVNQFNSYFEVQSYSSAKCEDAGNAAFGLVLMSFFLTLVITALNFIRISHDKPNLMKGNLALISASAIFLIGAFGKWTDCGDVMRTFYNDFGITVNYSTGFNTTVSAFVFIVLAGILNALVRYEEDTREHESSAI